MKLNSLNRESIGGAHALDLKTYLYITPVAVLLSPLLFADISDRRVATLWLVSSAMAYGVLLAWIALARHQSTSTGRNERIRTSDPLLPKQVRYQAAPHSVTLLAYRSRADKRTVARSNALKRNPSLCSFEIREALRNCLRPASKLTGLKHLVAGTGFEPVTFGL